MLTKKVGIDLGTTSTRIYIPKKGIVLNEPSVVARHVEDETIVAIGNEALDMVGRTPESIMAYRPLRNGVIADFRVTEQMLRHYINTALGSFRFSKPEVMISIPGGATSTERKAVIDAALSAGARETYLIQSPVAAALGAGIPIAEARGNLAIDIGGGTSEIAVISLSGIVGQTSVRVGGRRIDNAIADYVRQKYGLSIGQQTAEKVKHSICSAQPQKSDEKIEINGRDIVGGLPRSVTLKGNELVPIMEDVLDKLTLGIRSVLEKIPAELASDIADRGMILTGGGAQFKHLDRYLAKAIGVPCVVAQDAEICVAKGTGIALTHLEDYKKSLLGMSA